VDAAGGDVHLLGHSSGGLYCLLAGERLASLRSLIVYEPPLRLDRSEPGVMERVAAAVGADDPDGALDAFLPLAGISPGEIQFMRSMEPVWSRLCAGVRVLPRESEALAAEAGRFATLKRPDVPMLYLYGSETDAPIFPTIKEVGELFPEAQLCGLAGQRHVAQAFDPAGFAEAVLRFTAAHDG
jgi:pimeloyl-ACP methyl ester carboxylesterase